MVRSLNGSYIITPQSDRSPRSRPRLGSDGARDGDVSLPGGLWGSTRLWVGQVLKTGEDGLPLGSVLQVFGKLGPAEIRADCLFKRPGIDFFRFYALVIPR